MKPIFISSESGRGFSENDFLDKILEICDEHKKQKRALAFAFLIYDIEDASVRNVLENTVYWEALNKVAGKHLTVFYIESKLPQKTTPVSKVNVASQPLPGVMECLTGVNLGNLGLFGAKDKVAKSFGLPAEVKTPLVLFFQTDGKNVLDHFIVTLDTTRTEDSFLELKAHIDCAVASVKSVPDENYDNHVPVFELIRNEVQKGIRIRFISKKIVPKIGAGTVLALVKFFTGF